MAAAAVLLFLVIGVPATGGPAGMALFMPGFFRWFATWLPAPRTLGALTDTVYFAGHHVTASAWFLAAWALAGLAALAVRSVVTVSRGGDQ